MHHVEYDAFYLKFYSAHYIHYSLIYELGLFKRKPVNYDKNLIPKSFFKNVKITTFSDLAIDYYKRAINSFEIFGDKTIEYIHPRIIEMELLKPNPNMEDLRIKLNQFSKFIMDSKFKDLRSYPHIYLFKLNYIYSILILLRTGGPDSELLRIEDSDFYKKKAIAELDNAIKIELIENNQYGIVRGLFFKALTQFVAKKNKKQFSTEMDRLYEESKNRGFLREQKLFNKLRQENGLSLQDVLDIIKFYPVVLQ